MILHQKSLFNLSTNADLYIDVSKLGHFDGASIYRRLLVYDHTKLQHNLYIDDSFLVTKLIK